MSAFNMKMPDYIIEQDIMPDTGTAFMNYLNTSEAEELSVLISDSLGGSYTAGLST